MARRRKNQSLKTRLKRASVSLRKFGRSLLPRKRGRKRRRHRKYEAASVLPDVLSFIREAVDPEDRKVRIRAIVDYAKRNKGAYEMAPAYNPHQQVHHFIRFRHAEQMANSHKLGVSPKTRRITGSPVRRAHMQFRKAQAIALSKAGGDKSKLMNHAADKLTSTDAWKMYRRYRGLSEEALDIAARKKRLAGVLAFAARNSNIKSSIEKDFATMASKSRINKKGLRRLEFKATLPHTLRARHGYDAHEYWSHKLAGSSKVTVADANNWRKDSKGDKLELRRNPNAWRRHYAGAVAGARAWSGGARAMKNMAAKTYVRMVDQKGKNGG